jgi:hypothetical protein
MAEALVSVLNLSQINMERVTCRATLAQVNHIPKHFPNFFAPKIKF